MDMKNMSALARTARGLEPADLVIKNGRIINVYTQEIEAADLAVKNGRIAGIGRYSGLEEIDADGMYLAPGFIDAHIHLESCQLAPASLAGLIVPRGTTAVVADPHEIANVLGIRGIRLMIEATRRLPFDAFFMAPSCVPATGLETSGAVLSSKDLETLMDEPAVLGLAEVMNFPGVIEGAPDVLEKLNLFRQRVIDGHAPLLSGPDLCAYLVSGIATEHEATSVAEAREKLARGMHILIREGSQARNLETLLPLVDERNYHRVAFCTDDRHPDDLMTQGHLDHILRKAVALGLDPLRAIVMATLIPSQIYRLRTRGALAPGKTADIVLLDSLERLSVKKVFKNGRLAAENGELKTPLSSMHLPEWASPMNIKDFRPERLRLRAEKKKVRVIGLRNGQLLTNHLILDAPQRAGLLQADAERDLARLVVVERHHGTGNIGQGMVQGFGLRAGAMASSVAHDSHNIIAVGTSEADIYTAVKAVADMKGGQAVAAGGRILAGHPLPLAGLMSGAGGREVVASEKKLNDAAKEIGCRLDSPFMALSFLALPVIPFLKLTDRGLVDVSAFEFVSLWSD